MKYHELLDILEGESLFSSALILSGDVRTNKIRKQLSRWTKAGKIHSLRHGLYLLAETYRKRNPHPFVVANRMVQGSYVSCQSALAFHGMIPESLHAVTSVTVRRPGSWNTVLGRFEYRHVKSEFFHGYLLTDLGQEEKAFIALPEKALLDLFYLVPKSDSMAYVQELRLSFNDSFDWDRLFSTASHSPKLLRAVNNTRRLYDQEREGQRPS